MGVHVGQRGNYEIRVRVKMDGIEGGKEILQESGAEGLCVWED